MITPDRLLNLRKGITVLGVVVLIAFLAGLLGYGLLGSTSRYMADDYWTAYAVKTLPFWQLPAYWYLNWSGRFSFFFFVSLAELFGVKIVPFLPALGLAALTTATTLLIRQIFRFFSFQKPAFFSLVTGVILVFCSVHSTQNVLQSLYWQTGLLTYFIPVVIAVFYLALVLSQTHHPDNQISWLVLAGSGLLALVNGGFSETSVAVQVTALVLALAICLVSPSGSHRRRLVPWFAVGLAASLLAMGLIILAPGNQIRLAAGQPSVDTLPSRTLRLDVGYVIKASTANTIAFFKNTLRTHLPDAATALVLPGLIAFFCADSLPENQKGRLTRLLTLSLAAIPLGVFILVLSGHAPAYYVMHSGPPIRTEIIFQSILIFGLAGWGGAAGLLLRENLHISDQDTVILGWASGLIALMLLGIVPGRFMAKTAVQYPVLQGYAMAWDGRDQALQEAVKQGKKTAVVKPIGQLDQTLGDLRAEPDFWINQRAAEYYGLESIIAK